MARAIADGAPLRAFVTVAAWLHDPGTVGEVYGGAAGVAERLALAAAARARMDTTWCLAFRFADGRIQEVTNLCADQHAADQFFWSVYRLKPIPERLA